MMMRHSLREASRVIRAAWTAAGQALAAGAKSYLSPPGESSLVNSLYGSR